MNAVILAGGFGNRLMPLTASKPKPMLNICNVPMLDYSVSQLTHFGIKDIIFALAHKPEKIIEWTLGYKNVECHYNIEDTPLGTCGGVKNAYDFLEDSFFVLSGDGISNIDLNKMRDIHINSGAAVTMAVIGVRDPSLYGVVDVDKNGYIKSFVEKPKGYASGSYINCGIYLINKTVLKEVPDCAYDFSKDLFPDMLRRAEKMSVYVHSGYWSDVGSLESYYKSNLEIKKSGAFYLPEFNSFRKYFASTNMGKSENSLLGKTSKIFGTVKNSVVGNNCTILNDSTLENCVVLDNAVVSGRYKNCIIDETNIIDIDKIARENIKVQNSTNFLDRIFYNRQ